MAKRGFKFITVGNDAGFLHDGAAAQVKALKG
jgi:2-keto-3-deoxy-L-rhamnonate aldolase RhmA